MQRAKHALERQVASLQAQLAHATSQAEGRQQSLVAELKQRKVQAEMSARIQRCAPCMLCQ